MLALLSGQEGKLLRVPKDSNIAALPLVILDKATGIPHALSTATVDVVVYSRSDRNVVATATHSATVVTAANGSCTLSIDDSALTYGPGDYYAFVRRTLSGNVTFCRKPFVMRIF